MPKAVREILEFPPTPQMTSAQIAAVIHNGFKEARAPEMISGLSLVLANLIVAHGGDEVDELFDATITRLNAMVEAVEEKGALT
jgi:hypothetical protein